MNRAERLPDCYRKDEYGNICKFSEPLKYYQEHIERIQFKKRYAMIRHRLWGEERTFVLGILLKEDIHQEYLLNGRLTEKMFDECGLAADARMPLVEME